MNDPDINTFNQDILMATDQIVAHCCNTRNTMNSGVAKALRTRFPEIYESDRAAYINHGKDLLGQCIMVDVTTKTDETYIKYLANLYGQPNYGYDGTRYVDYEALYQSLEALLKYAQELKATSIGMPFKLASDRAGGHWLIVLEMIKHIFAGSGIKINLYKI